MAAKQILFLQKNKADITNTTMVVSASEGNAYVLNALNRSNITAWITTGSTDASNTTYTVNFGEPRRISCIGLILHNFKAYTIQWFDGSVWQDFSSIIAETNYTAQNSYYDVTLVHAEQVRITIQGTQIANSDKYLYQLILSEPIGRLNGWPVITNPKLDRNLQSSKMLSGKTQITQNLGGWSFSLEVAIWTDAADMSVVQQLYTSPEGFLVYLCGGDDSQFMTPVEPYRGQDILLMRTATSYSPPLYKGLYKTGYQIKLDLAEVTE